MTQLQVAVLAGLGWHSGIFGFGILILVAFSGLRRTAELVSRRACHVAVSRQEASLMPMIKTGNRTGHPESVVIDDVGVGWVPKQLVETRAPMGRLWPGSADGSSEESNVPYSCVCGIILVGGRDVRL